MPVCPIDGCQVDGMREEAIEDIIALTASDAHLVPTYAWQEHWATHEEAHCAPIDPVDPDGPMSLLAKKLKLADSTAYLASASTKLYRTKKKEDWSWGCGYRNMQILLSALSTHPEVKGRLPSEEMTIPDLQKALEMAWQQGFDVAGAQQLKGKVLGEKTWIGATEAYTILCGFGIK
ncbi:peptidase family C78-domain-containing protein [Piptocephalis cylindrospora]|uniref:Peptidase family C78-domain-containing protein n=1 Tax=Piptocephalis cylindrospora TaxID=1907219 RepID=A0A4P9Y626_9FUNG|nr:peptidase family C78-domain-containing protein [Piptocephalis cylindrospora]|eukprot:RKP13280.1 peptidase family C78-domain-containing protein [Piptocephalis cylindrospora]